MALDSYKRKALDIVPEKEYIEGSDKEGLYTFSKKASDKKDLSSYDYLQMKKLLEDDVKSDFFGDIEGDPFAELILKGMFSAEEIGKATINTPSVEKKKAQTQESKMNPLEKEVLEKISSDISVEDKKFQEDLEFDYEKMLREIEG